MKVIIMRGLPGSGKSTWIKKTFTDPGKVVIVCSADDFHLDKDGNYNFDPALAGEAHNCCLRKFLITLEREIEGPTKGAIEAVIVDNTNTTLAELAPYVRLAEALGFKYTIVQTECSIQTAVERNIHGVPVGTMFTMRKNLWREIPPSYWNIELLRP